MTPDERTIKTPTRRHRDALRTVRKLREIVKAWQGLDRDRRRELLAVKADREKLLQKYLALPACHRHCWLRKAQP